MSAQVETTATVNETLDAPRPKFAPVTMELVCERLRRDADARAHRRVSDVGFAHRSNTPVTPTVRTAPPVDRNADPAVRTANQTAIGPLALPASEASSLSTGDRIRSLKSARDRLLQGLNAFPINARERVERELAASVLHHRLRDVLLGGPGRDTRSPGELQWEKAYRRLPDGPDRQETRRLGGRFTVHRTLHDHIETYTTIAWDECY